MFADGHFPLGSDCCRSPDLAEFSPRLSSSCRSRCSLLFYVLATPLDTMEEVVLPLLIDDDFSLILPDKY